MAVPTLCVARLIILWVMPNPKPYKPKLQFLRNLLPDTMSEAEIEAEEARLMRYIALVERIAIRLNREAARSGPDSQNPGNDSKM